MILRPATARDCWALAPTLREADCLEIAATSGRPPILALLDGYVRSDECWVAEHAGQLVAMWGVAKLAGSVLCGRVGCVWMLTSGLVERHPKLFMQYCHQELRRLLSAWSSLHNAIDCRHTKAVRWAKKLGFKLEEPAPFGVQELPFVRFSVTLEDLDVRTSNDGNRRRDGSGSCNESVRPVSSERVPVSG